MIAARVRTPLALALLGVTLTAVRVAAQDATASGAVARGEKIFLRGAEMPARVSNSTARADLISYLRYLTTASDHGVRVHERRYDQGL